MKKQLSRSAVVLAAALAVSPGLSPAQNAASIKPQATPAGIEYVAGGIGDAQQQAMKDMRQNYNLHLTFARPSGNYLADVKVLIENARKETVMDVVAPGPLLFAEVPDGEYKVTAKFGGQSQTKNVTLRNSGAKSLVYHFPEN